MGQAKLSGGNDISQSYIDLTTAFQAFNSAKLLLEITENGGIPELPEQVELTMSWEVYDQYNLLMLESPNLTEDVLIAAIENPEFPALLIKLLCLANPHSSRSADVMDALYVRVPALSAADIQEIEDQLEIFTQFDKMRSEVAAHKHGIDVISHDIKRWYYKDTLNDWSVDSLQAFLLRENTLNSMYELANFYLLNHQFSELDALMQLIYQNFDMTETELIDYNHYLTFFAICEDLIDNNLTPEDLTLDQVDDLEAMILNGMHYYVRGAWGLLVQYDEEYIYEEEILHTTTSSPRLAKRPALSKREKEFSIFPNPAYDFFIVKYYSPEFFSKGSIEIVDITGRLLQINQISSSANEILIDAKALKPGVYLVILRGDGRIISTERLIINK